MSCCLTKVHANQSLESSQEEYNPVFHDNQVNTITDIKSDSFAQRENEIQRKPKQIHGRGKEIRENSGEEQSKVISTSKRIKNDDFFTQLAKINETINNDVPVQILPKSPKIGENAKLFRNFFMYSEDAFNEKDTDQIYEFLRKKAALLSEEDVKKNLQKFSLQDLNALQELLKLYYNENHDVEFKGMQQIYSSYKNEFEGWSIVFTRYTPKAMNELISSVIKEGYNGFVEFDENVNPRRPLEVITIDLGSVDKGVFEEKGRIK
jgi:hypothetical protein